MYRVVVLRTVEKLIARLAAVDERRVRAALDALAYNPRPPGCMRLTGSSRWRIRVGDYRVIYEIDDPARTIIVVMMGHRRDVYR